jgi:3-keto-disaccharide hydrolase
MTKRLAIAVTAFVMAGFAQQKSGADLGFKDTPMLPGDKWHVHDPDRPHPRVVTPGAVPGAAPSDATILFDGKDLSKWMQKGKDGKLFEPKWPVRDGYFEVDARHGDLVTKESFGDCQLHVEWASPAVVEHSSQSRGNSGVLVMSLYEIQVLDSYNNPTYADGQAGAIYGQWPPLVNATRPPGEWQAYDIIFEAPRFKGDKLERPAYETVILNGVLLHNHQASLGPMVYRKLAHYEPHAAELPLMLQDHNTPVHYRNIWIRKIGNYDEPEK